MIDFSWIPIIFHIFMVLFSVILLSLIDSDLKKAIRNTGEVSIFYAVAMYILAASSVGLLLLTSLMDPGTVTSKRHPIVAVLVDPMTSPTSISPSLGSLGENFIDSAPSPSDSNVSTEDAPAIIANTSASMREEEELSSSLASQNTSSIRQSIDVITHAIGHTVLPMGVKLDIEPIENLPTHQCNKCQVSQPLRAKHCKYCKKCIYKYDHHCPWIRNCVGELNHLPFILLLITHIVFSMLGEHCAISALHSGDDGSWTLISVSVLLAMVIGGFSILFAALLLCMHLYLISVNLTTWEYASREKISYFHAHKKRVKQYLQSKKASLTPQEIANLEESGPFDAGIPGNWITFLCSKKPRKWIARLPYNIVASERKGFFSDCWNLKSKKRPTYSVLNQYNDDDDDDDGNDVADVENAAYS